MFFILFSIIVFIILLINFIYEFNKKIILKDFFNYYFNNRNRPTQADIKIFDLFNGIEPNSLFNHVLRWFKHLNSFNFNERNCQ